MVRSDRLKITGNLAHRVALVAQIMNADLRPRSGAPDALAYREMVGDDLLYGVALAVHVGEFLASRDNVFTTTGRRPAGGYAAVGPGA